MKTMQKIIYAGFATCALASASLPALSWTVWPDVDFEWYAQVGKMPPPGTVQQEKYPAPRVGEIWVPAHYENVPGNGKQLVAGRWIKDDYYDQVAVYANPSGTQVAAVPAGASVTIESTPSGPVIASGPPPVLYDREGKPIPTNPEAYPVDSARR